MPEFIFRGTVTLNGATFYISAPTREEALKRAAAGAFDDCEHPGAEMIDWYIQTGSIEENS